MPDGEMYALAQRIVRLAEAQFEAFAAERGLPMPGEVVTPWPNLFEGWSHAAGDAYQFATGYDSGTGTTTMAFTTSVSILTDGTTGDILTGS